MSLRKVVIALLKEAYREVFPKFLFHIIGKDVDDLTKRATFVIKAKKNAYATAFENKRDHAR